MRQARASQRLVRACRGMANTPRRPQILSRVDLHATVTRRRFRTRPGRTSSPATATDVRAAVQRPVLDVPASLRQPRRCALHPNPRSSAFGRNFHACFAALRPLMAPSDHGTSQRQGQRRDSDSHTTRQRRRAPTLDSSHQNVCRSTAGCDVPQPLRPARTGVRRVVAVAGDSSAPHLPGDQQAAAAVRRRRSRGPRGTGRRRGVPGGSRRRGAAPAHLPDRIRQAGALLVGAHPVAVAEQHRDSRGTRRASGTSRRTRAGPARGSLTAADVVGRTRACRRQCAGAIHGRTQQRTTTIGCAAPSPSVPARRDVILRVAGPLRVAGESRGGQRSVRSVAALTGAAQAVVAEFGVRRP